MSEHQPRQVDYGCANDGLLDEEAPDLGPLQEAAEAAELPRPCLGSPIVPAARPPPVTPPPVRLSIARALTENGFTLHHCARHHPRYRLGGVCLLPVAAGYAPEGKAGVVVSWTTHDLLSLGWCRWHEYHCPQEVVNGALGHVLGGLGFQLVPFGSRLARGRMRCRCGSPPAIRTPTISAVSTTMASHRAGDGTRPR